MMFTVFVTEFSAVKMREQGGSYGVLEVTIGIDDCHTGQQGHQIIHPVLFDSHRVSHG